MRFLFPSSRHERTFLTPCAQHSRRNPTPSERILWEALRGRRLGVKFRRQVVLGFAIVDFFAPEPRLAVEVDGAAASGAIASGTRTSRATACACFA
jgi:very-short-patch-repair endonuclease